jgi:hypothetical protein
MTCPSCQSPKLVEGRIIAVGSKSGAGQRFSPSGIRVLTLKRSVSLKARQDFQACMQCGHVWSTVDVTELQSLIDMSATAKLKAKLGFTDT